MTDRGARRTGGRPLATPALAVVLVAALVTYLVLGRHLWFYSDEWDYIADRSVLARPGDLFRAHNGQWQTIPIVVYRVLLHLTALHTYWPYLVLVVVLYLVVCGQLYALAVRAGVRPWIALLSTVPAVFFGVAAENIVFAAQLTYFGSVAFGLAQVLLLTRRTMRGRTVAAAAALAVAGLMCSNLGVVMAVVGFVVALLHRGLRTALAVTVPAAVAFVVWYLLAGDGGQTAFGGTGRFVEVGLRATGSGVTQQGDTGAAVLAAVLLIGLVLLARSRPAALRVPVALIVGAVAFLAITGSQRAAAFGADAAASPRYVSVLALLLVPVAAAAVDGLWSTLRPLGLAGLVVVLLGVPPNLSMLSSITRRAERVASAEQLVVGAVTVSGAESAPADLRPFPESTLAPLATIGYLRDAARRGDLPAVAPLTPAQRRSDTLRLALYQTDAHERPGSCTVLTAPRVVRARAGDVLRLAGGLVDVRSVGTDVSRGIALYYNPNRGDALRVLRGDYRLRLSSRGVNGPARLCS